MWHFGDFRAQVFNLFLQFSHLCRYFCARQIRQLVRSFIRTTARKLKTIMSKENVRKRAQQEHHRSGRKPDRNVDRPRKKGKGNELSRKYHWLAIIVGGVFGIILFAAIVCGVVYFYFSQHMQSVVRLPLQAEKVIASDASLPAVSPERFWGTYRPQLYFGIKSRSPTSPLFGLMWFRQPDSNRLPNIRHWCDQGDGLRYGWSAHDGVNFGWQDILDDGYVLQTFFAKRQGGQHGGDWTAKIVVRPLEQRGKQPPPVVSLMFYTFQNSSRAQTPDIAGRHITTLRGYTDDLGYYVVKFLNPSENVQKSSYLITHTTDVDQLKEVIIKQMYLEPVKRGSTKNYATLVGNVVPRGKGGQENLFVNQLTVTLPFEMEVVFESASFADRPDEFASEVFLKAFQNHLSTFDKKFEEVFQLQKKGFKDKEVKFAKATFSNLIGGVGYFYGASRVQSEWNPEPVEYWEAPLYTAVPSRSFFPRGFLWDEGFHNLLISQWDATISKDIIGHWLDLMNQEGWIPREQILGSEARAKVPDEFVVQKNKNANPPTFFLPLKTLVKDMIQRHNKEDVDYLKRIFPRLKAWFQWYNTSQLGHLPTSYRWKGRDPNNKFELNPKTLTSGLDDAPRASHPTDEEYHVDLRCWMALASGIMADIAKAIGMDADAYATTHKRLTDNESLNKLHWSPKDKRYCDYGLHSDKVKLVKPGIHLKVKAGHQQTSDAEAQMIRRVMKDPKYQFVNSYSYLSLFPFLLHVLDPSSENLGQILNDLRDPNLLWTNYGLRSLARTAPLYNKHNTEHDPPYWRGAIWINMNFLAVRALNHYSSVPGPHQATAKDLHKTLRGNLIKNIYFQFSQTGFVWEQYDDKTGQGKGSHPFTGWTSLVVLMMAEKY